MKPSLMMAAVASMVGASSSLGSNASHEFMLKQEKNCDYTPASTPLPKSGTTRQSLNLNQRQKRKAARRMHAAGFKNAFKKGAAA